MIGVLPGMGMKVSLGYLVTHQVRLQGVTVGHRDEFKAMTRAMQLHKIKPILDKEFAFDDLKQALAYLKCAGHFGEICIAH